MSWWSGPLAGLDTETTSADPETARIVTACVAYRAPGIVPEPQDTRRWLVNPGVPISAEAARIHGITDEMAAAMGVDAAKAIDEIRLAFRAMCQHAPAVVFNAPFDLTILDRECRRHGLPPPVLDDVLILDPLVLDKHVDRYRKGSRRLADQCKHYRVPHNGAHDAAEDVLAAMRVAWRLGQSYRGVGGMDGRALMHLQRAAYKRQAESLADYFRRCGSPRRVDTHWPLIPVASQAPSTAVVPHKAMSWQALTLPLELVSGAP